MSFLSYIEAVLWFGAAAGVLSLVGEYLAWRQTAHGKAQSAHGVSALRKFRFLAYGALAVGAHLVATAAPALALASVVLVFLSMSLFRLAGWLTSPFAHAARSWAAPAMTGSFLLVLGTVPTTASHAVWLTPGIFTAAVLCIAALCLADSFNAKRDWLAYLRARAA